MKIDKKFIMIGSIIGIGLVYLTSKESEASILPEPPDTVIPLSPNKSIQPSPEPTLVPVAPVSEPPSTVIHLPSIPTPVPVPAPLPAPVAIPSYYNLIRPEALAILIATGQSDRIYNLAMAKERYAAQAKLGLYGSNQVGAIWMISPTGNVADIAPPLNQYQDAGWVAL